MELLPRKLSIEQASIMKNILDQQLTIIQNERVRQYNFGTVPRNINSNINNYQKSSSTQNLQNEVMKMQNKMLELENKLHQNADRRQQKLQQRDRILEQGINEETNLRSSNYSFKNFIPKTKSRRHRDAAFRRIESSEEILDALELSLSIHSQLSQNTRQESPQRKQEQTNLKSSDKQIEDLKIIRSLKKNLDQERQKRKEAQKEAQNLQNILQAKDKQAKNYSELQDQIKDLSLQLVKSEKIRERQKELIEDLKYELIQLRKENQVLEKKKKTSTTNKQKNIQTTKKKPQLS